MNRTFVDMLRLRAPSALLSRRVNPFAHFRQHIHVKQSVRFAGRSKADGGGGACKSEPQRRPRALLIDGTPLLFKRCAARRRIIDVVTSDARDRR